VLNQKTKKKRRFSDSLIAEEQQKLYKFREIFREIIQILKKKNKSGSLENFGSTKEKRDQTIISMVCSGDRSLSEHEVKIVLEKIYEFRVGPLEVGQPVKILALHPKVGGLHTGSVLTSNIDSAHVQFDREDFGS
jgi:hypothetical protein